jgi:hypothetical protein
MTFFRGKIVPEKPAINLKFIENGKKSLKNNIFDPYFSKINPCIFMECS